MIGDVLPFFRKHLAEQLRIELCPKAGIVNHPF